MHYIWQHPLTDITNEPVAPIISAYYNRLQQEAAHLLQTINGSNLKERLPKLHGIEERCSLLFCFLENPELCDFWSAEEQLVYIEKEYRNTYYERFDRMDDGQVLSLLHVVA